MKLVLLLLLVFSAFVPVKSQTPEDSVKAAVNNLFIAMKNSDGIMLRSCFGDSAVLQALSKDKAGNLLVKNESVKDFANSISTMPKGALDERITFDMIKIDGPLASVWTPYSFYYNGKFSHCGVNSFQLLRTASGWKIQYIIDTRRATGCL
jgi:hypothetical protein